MSHASHLARAALRLLTLRKIDVADVPDSPGLLLALWIAAASLHIVDFVVIPADGSYTASTALLMVCGALLSALLAAWIVGRGPDAVRFGVVFMLSAVTTGLIWLVMLVLPYTGVPASAIATLTIVPLVWWLAVLFVFVARTSQSPRRWGWSALSVLAFFGVFEGATHVAELDYRLMMWAYGQDDSDASGYVEIDADTLWPAQPGLVEASLARMNSERSPSSPFLVAVAAGGSQQLFGREAKAVQSLLARRFGSGAGTVLLSNASADLNKVPLANRTNLSAVLEGLGQSFDSSRDLAIIYLMAHGCRDAALQTDLPDFTDLHEISAAKLAAALNKNGIRRRIVIVSACYSGTWIKPLATPDTIVIAAAAADRTSFGCDDNRAHTVFGDALLNSGLDSGASLHEAFETLKTRIGAEEAKERLTPSLPQAFVGERMREVWDARSSEQQAAIEGVASRSAASR